jgi:hypothetical protein
MLSSPFGARMLERFIEDRDNPPPFVETTRLRLSTMAFRVRPQQITLTLGVFGSPVGFDIGEVRPGRRDRSRSAKPSIALIGQYGIPIRDKIELERQAES